MNVSPLLSSLIKGQWAIDPRLVESNRVIIDKLLSRGYTSEDGKLLSASTPIGMSVTASNASEFSPWDEREMLDALAPESTLLFNITGTMLKYGTWCSYGTEEIAQSLLSAGMHGNVGSLVLNLDSGGGSADSIAPLAFAISELKKRGKAVIGCVDLCASACYFVASYCDEIIAGNDISSEIGSIGVMCTLRDYSKYFENNGVKEHVIYSSLSDYKNRPFELAIKGEYDEIRKEELDPLAIRFQAAIRANRGSKLNEETPGLLAGRMFFAEEAQQAGLIDHVSDLNLAVQRAREIREYNLVKNYYTL